MRAALLVAPPAVQRAELRRRRSARRPIAWQRLPFAATLVMSGDDPYCSAERGAQMAHAWGATLVVAGARGHLDSASGLGEWPEGLLLLDALLDALLAA